MKNDVSRRGFLAAGGAVAALGVAGALSSCAPTESSPATTSAEEPTWTDSADVIVIGGGTGIMAAVKAAQDGASVLMFDKRGSFGGEMKISGGVIYAGGTSVQKTLGDIDERTGKADTVEATLEDWLARAKEGVNVDLATKIVTMGPDIIDYFLDKGVEFETYQSGLDPIARGHQTSSHLGNDLVDAMLVDCDNLGVKYFAGEKVVEILTDENNTIIGVKTLGEEGYKSYGAKAIVVSTGGPDDNTDLTMTYNPEAIKWLDFGSGKNMGDGFYLTEKLGAARVGQLNWLDHDYPNPALLGVMGDALSAYTQEMFLSYAVPFAQAGPRPAIFVDIHAQRFSDETKGYPAGLGVEIARLDAGYCYNIFDEELWNVDEGTFPHYISLVGATKESLAEGGVLFEAASIAELATTLGLDPDALDATVAKWNSLVERGEDTDFGRPANTLQKIEVSPFYAYKITPAFAVPQGGACISLDIDENCNVLDRDGGKIDGLYASGTGMTFYRAYGRGYPGSGSNLAAGFACGYIAGENAAKFASA